jgi:hypothetical protein
MQLTFCEKLITYFELPKVHDCADYSGMLKLVRNNLVVETHT